MEITDLIRHAYSLIGEHDTLLALLEHDASKSKLYGETDYENLAE